MSHVDATPRTTNLAIPFDLRERIEASAGGDKRKPKAQMLILLQEALDARDRKAGRKLG